MSYFGMVSYDDFLKDYAGLTHPEGMEVIKIFDEASINWKNGGGVLGDLLCVVYERYWTDQDSATMANEMIMVADEVMKDM